MGTVAVDKINRVSNLKKTYYNFIDGVAIDKHNTIYTNHNTNVSKINKLLNFNDHNFFTKEIRRTYK